MSNLKLKELAPYLPYGLKAKGYWGVRTINTLHKEKEHHYYAEFEEKEKRREQIWTIKPILRPLSDLTEEEFSFVYENETDYESIEQLVELDAESFLTCCFSYAFWQSLFENHFDVFGLIEKGIAIDINTLK